MNENYTPPVQAVLDAAEKEITRKTSVTMYGQDQYRVSCLERGITEIKAALEIKLRAQEALNQIPCAKQDSLITKAWMCGLRDVVNNILGEPSHLVDDLKEPAPDA